VLYVTIVSESKSQALTDLALHTIGRILMRAWMVIWSAERVTVTDIAVRLRYRPKTVREWMHRFQCEGTAGRADVPRSGRLYTAPCGLLCKLVVNIAL
jgi:hypothetical protein